MRSRILRLHVTRARDARLLSAALLFFLVLAASVSTSTAFTHTVPEALPLIFELNAGQTSPEVKFLSRGVGYTLFLTPAEAVLGFVTSPNKEKGAVVRMTLPGANPQARIAGLEELPGKVNYFIGDDPARWRTNVPTYAKVRYESVYPGVDLIYYGNQRQFEYDFVVAPGADPRAITLAFEGPEALSVDAKGDLVFRVGDGELRLLKPLVYQEVNGSRRQVAASYVLRSTDRVGVQIAAYDTTRPLVIDPVLVYSTYLGGSGADIARGIAADKVTAGIVYVTGDTISPNFPTKIPYQSTLGKSATTDCFITKIDTRNVGASSLIYSTYLGGSSNDQCFGIAVDGSGSAYVTGQTSSTNFPGSSLSKSKGSGDIFVVKLNPAGSAISPAFGGYSVFLGGSSSDAGFAIAVDSANQAYVTGKTTSKDFPVVGGFQAGPGVTGGDPSGDAFVTKLNAAGTAILYSTYLGGSGADQGNGIAVDPRVTQTGIPLGIVYVTGSTASSNFTVKNGFQMTPGTPGGGTSDAFVAKVDTGATGFASLLYSTYLGGIGADSGFGIATDGVSAYVTGQTASNLSSSNPLLPTAFGTPPSGSPNAFAARIDTNPGPQATVAFLAYLGGGSGNAIAVDAVGDTYVTGQTGGFPQGSTEFPTSNAFQQTYGGNGDAFVARLNTFASLPPGVPPFPLSLALIYGSYLGGAGTDQGLGITLDSAGDGYVTGSTSTTNFPPTNFPPPGAFQPAYGGGTTDAFVARITDIAKTADLSITKSGPDQVGAGAQFAYTLTVKNAGPNVASNVKVSDILPAGVTLVSASGTNWNCSGTTTVICVLVGSLAAPTTGNPPVSAPDITITVRAPGEGTLKNKASVSADTPLLHPENNSSNEVSTSVLPRADLSITKTVSASAVVGGAPFTYKLTVKNAGPSTASIVTVSDTLPAGVTLLSAGGSGWSCIGNPAVTCTLGSLPVGTAADIVLSVTAGAAGGTIFNKASVSSDPSTPDPDLSNNSATAQTVVNEQVNEGTTLTFQVAAKDASGNPLTYSASNLPQGATFDPSTLTFTWTPNSAQGGPNPYLVYFTASNGQSTTTAPVTITVVDTINDSDFDGVPFPPDNCPNVYNPDQADVCHNSPETVVATSALSQTTSTGGALNLTFTASFNGGTNGTYFVPVNLFNTICRLTNGAGQPVQVGAVAEGPPIVLSPSPAGNLAFAPANTTVGSQTTFDLKLLYPGLAPGTYTVACDYVNFAHIPKPNPPDPNDNTPDPTIWKGIASADPQTIVVGLYAFSGFASPADHQPFNQGRTVPVKFSLRNSSGAFVSTAVARLFVQKLDSQGNTIPSPDGDLKPATSNNSPDNQFRYDFNNNQYIFNMSTDTLTVGLWRLVLKLDNGTTETIVIVITT